MKMVKREPVCLFMEVWRKLLKGLLTAAENVKTSSRTHRFAYNVLVTLEAAGFHNEERDVKTWVY